MISPEQKVGDYTLVRKLGEGGMGVVYEAVHTLIGRRVALKIFHPELAQTPQLYARFLNEARAANQVQHSGLVQVHDYGQNSDGAAYLIMELVAGESLDRHLAEQNGRALLPTLAVGVTQQVALALAAAHEHGVIHRDIKPANIMLVADAAEPGGERAKVLDFGIAKLLDGPELPRGRTRTGALVGTAEYMSPEQCRADTNLSAAVDVYALGVMLYEMLSGRRPFFAESAVETMTLHLRAVPQSLKELAPSLPAALIGLVHRMMAKQPADRPSMTTVAEELRRLLPDLAQLPAAAATAPPAPASSTVSDVEPAPAPPQQNRRALWPWLSALAAVVLAICVGYAFRHRGKVVPAPPIAAAMPAPPSVIAAPVQEAPRVELKAPAAAPAIPVAAPSTMPAPRTAVSRKSTSVRKQSATATPPPGADALPLLMRHKEPDGP